MGNPAVLQAALLDRLRTITTVNVYDVDVPDHPPAEPGTGRVYPYAVAWGSAGYTPAEARNLAGDAEAGLTWPAPVTVAAGDVTWCLEAAHLVRQALEGHQLTPTASPLREDEGTPAVQVDREATPTRFYVPMTFRCTTP